MDLKQACREIQKNIPKLSYISKKNLFNVVNLQTNDELMESLNRLELKEPFIDEYVRAMKPIVYPISIQGVFDANERTGRGIAMTMVYSAIKLTQNQDCMNMLGYSKSLFHSKTGEDLLSGVSSLTDDYDLAGPSAVAKIVYDMRKKKGI